MYRVQTPTPGYPSDTPLKFSVLLIFITPVNREVVKTGPFLREMPVGRLAGFLYVSLRKLPGRDTAPPADCWHTSGAGFSSVSVPRKLTFQSRNAQNLKALEVGFMAKRTFRLRLGERIRDLRNKKRVRQNVLAGMVGITPAALTNFEKGRRSVSLDWLRRIADALEHTDRLLPAGGQEEDCDRRPAGEAAAGSLEASWNGSPKGLP